VLLKERWLVPKMVKKDHKSSFVYWSLIWTCLTGNLDHFERRQIMGFQQILKKTEFFHNTLRLHLARLELKGTRKHQKHVYTSKLAPNQKTRIKTILHQYRDKPARASLLLNSDFNRFYSTTILPSKHRDT